MKKADCTFCQVTHPEQTALRDYVSEHLEEIDPANELDWFSFVIGWAFGRGMTSEQAHAFSSHVRYHTELT